MRAGCTVTDAYPWYDRVNFMGALCNCNTEFHSHMHIFSSYRKCSPLLSKVRVTGAPGRLHTAISHMPGLVGAAPSRAVASQAGGFTGHPGGFAVV